MNADHARNPAHAIVASVRAAQAAFPPSPDDTPYDRAKRATAAIAEAGLRLREAVTVLDNGLAFCAVCACELASEGHAPGCAAAEFDAAVRAACGEVGA